MPGAMRSAWDHEPAGGGTVDVVARPAVETVVVGALERPGDDVHPDAKSAATAAAVTSAAAVRPAGCRTR